MAKIAYWLLKSVVSTKVWFWLRNAAFEKCYFTFFSLALQTQRETEQRKKN